LPTSIDNDPSPGYWPPWRKFMSSDAGVNLSDFADLFTDEDKARLLENGRVPVVRLLEPLTNASWFISAINPSNMSQLWGLVDLRNGAPEVGPIDWAQLSLFRNAENEPLVRDDLFQAEGRTLSQLLAEAKERGEIDPRWGDIFD
jgi:hypothetical protein